MRLFRYLLDIVSLKFEKISVRFVVYFLIKRVMCIECRKFGNFKKKLNLKK